MFAAAPRNRGCAKFRRMIWFDFESATGEVEEGDVVVAPVDPMLTRRRAIAYSLVIPRSSLPRRMADLTKRAKVCRSALWIYMKARTWKDTEVHSRAT